MTINTLEKSEYKLEKTYQVSVFEQDVNHSIKPASLLNLLQDVASCNIDNTTYSNPALNEQNLGWFLVRYRIEFDKYPTGINDIVLKTENRGVQKLSAYRDFEAFTIDGERILRATTSWLMVNLDTKSLINIEQKFPNFFHFEKREDDLELKKLRTLQEWDSEKTFHVRYEDLDMNGHVNNTVYISWAIEALGFDFLTSHEIKNIDIYYKHEVRYGDDIISYVKHNPEEKTTEHMIKNSQTGDEVCLIKFEWA